MVARGHAVSLYLSLSPSFVLRLPPSSFTSSVLRGGARTLNGDLVVSRERSRAALSRSWLADCYVIVVVLALVLAVLAVLVAVEEEFHPGAIGTPRVPARQRFGFALKSHAHTRKSRRACTHPRRLSNVRGL